jgi:phage terminase large subunit
MLTPTMLAKRVGLLEDSRRNTTIKHLTINGNSMIIHAKDHDKIYVPTHTGNLVHDDDNYIRLVMGPYGSGKSTLCVTEIVKRACQMPRWYAGRRRSRWAIVRNTSGELQSTTLATWLAWFEELGDIRKRQKPILTYEHSFNDGHGIVELELLFIALDRPEDVRKIKSLELTGCYINEASEVPKAALAHMKGRVNRYPSKAFCTEEYWSGILADTNPPPTDHWIFKDFEENKYEGHVLFKQPPGLIKNEDKEWERNPNADNADHLPDDYYLKLAHGQTQEFVNVFCLGVWGTVGFGKKVYPEFNSDLHAVDDIEAIQGEPLFLAFDFGLTPACIVGQVSSRGQVRLLKEYVGIDIGLRTFTESIVLPGIAKEFPYSNIGSCTADPSGASRDQILDEMSCISELNSLGIKTEAARTNQLEPRIAAVRYFLNRMIDGKPALILSKKGCPVLYNAFVKDYVYKRVAVSGEERYKDTPDKNMASHISDATQYLCLELSSDNILQEKQSIHKSVDMFNPVFRWN